MGWSGGSVLAEELWSLVSVYLTRKDRKRVARAWIEIFEGEDCDTITEAEQLCYDAEYEYDEDEEEWVYR